MPTRLIAEEKTMTVTAYARAFKKYEWDGMGYSSSYDCSDIDTKTKQRQAAFTTYVGPLKTRMPFRVGYPVISQGDVIPMFGTLWSVGRIQEVSRDSPGGGYVVDGNNDGVVKLTHVDDDDPMAKVSPNCLVIPFGARVTRHYHASPVTSNPTYILSDLELLEKNNQRLVRFNVRVQDFHGLKRESKKGFEESVELKVGDRFRVPASHRVFQEGKEVLREREDFMLKQIVPPNPEQHRLGWIALSPLDESWPNLRPTGNNYPGSGE